MNQIVDWLVHLFILTVPIEQIFYVPGLGTLTRAAGLLVFTAWFANLVLLKRVRWPHPFHIFACLYFIWSICSIFWTYSMSDTIEKANTYLQMGILIFILWDRLRNYESLRIAMQAYIFGVYFSVSTVFLNFLVGNQGKFGRFTAGDFDDNDLGIIISLGVPMAWYLLTEVRKDDPVRRLKVANALFIPIAILGILLTASRTAMISLLPSLLYIISTIRNFTIFHQLTFFILGIVSVITLPFVIPADTFLRLATAGESISSGDMNGRMEIWKHGFQNYVQEPLLGVGSGAFKTTIELGQSPHNTILAILFEVGFIGFLLFIAASLIAFVCSAKSSRLWLAMFSILLIGAMSLSWAHRKPTWVVFSLGVVHSHCCVSAKKSVNSPTIVG